LVDRFELVLKFDFSPSNVDTQKLEKSPQSMTFDAVSTVMADFTKPEGFERPVSYKPPVQSRYSTEKFDDETISSMAYKPFPVKPYELPIWAKKPKYKQPEGGMCMNTLYMVSGIIVGYAFCINCNMFRFNFTKSDMTDCNDKKINFKMDHL
jgi:hypothetical protein